MMITVSVIFDTGYTYSCYSKKVEFVDIEESKLPRNIKGVAKDLDITGFFIAEYSIRI